jgi:hypothetical protein
MKWVSRGCARRFHTSSPTHSKASQPEDRHARMRIDAPLIIQIRIAESCVPRKVAGNGEQGAREQVTVAGASHCQLGPYWTAEASGYGVSAADDCRGFPCALCRARGGGERGLDISADPVSRLLHSSLKLPAIRPLVPDARQSRPCYKIHQRVRPGPAVCRRRVGWFRAPWQRCEIRGRAQ